MNKAELIESLKKLHDSDDTEVAHGLADDLLLAFINDDEVTQAFEDVPRWYS